MALLEVLDVAAGYGAGPDILTGLTMRVEPDRSYCIIAEWNDMEALANARPNMIKTLDSFRDTLEDLGGGLGVTDPVGGPVVLALK